MCKSWICFIDLVIMVWVSVLRVRLCVHACGGAGFGIEGVDERTLGDARLFN